MRTNVVIDDILMEDARQLAGTRTKRETIDLALRELVGRRRRLKTLGLRGRFPDFPTIEQLREEEGREWS